jgi:hypothetical protein
MTDRQWLWVSGLLTFPLAAVLHNGVFYLSNCMLNPFGPSYLDMPTLGRWLSRDPALPWSIVLAALINWLGHRIPALRTAVWPLLFCFLPLTIWIWDIPLTDRLICRLFHDGKLMVLGVPVRSRHFYLAGLVSYLLVIAVIGWRSRRGLPDSANSTKRVH